MTDAPLRILLVEDDPDHADLIAADVADCQRQVELEHVCCGEDALERLATSTFNLVLLDLGLPGLSGRETLVQIKSDSRLRDMPVVVLTSSRYIESEWQDDRPVRTCYVEKPMSPQQLDTVIQMVEHFWFAIKNKSHASGSRS